MEYLCRTYKDELYRSYLDSKPSFSIAVVSKKGLQLQNKSVRVRETEYHFRVSHYKDWPFCNIRKETRLTLDAKMSGILKSNWCWKHLTLSPSCVLVCVDWDALGNTALDEGLMLSSFAQLKDYTTQYRSRFILVLVTKNKSPETANAAAQFNKLRNDAKTYFGSDFKNVVQLFESGMDEYSLSVLYQMIVELAIAYHKGEIVRLMNMKSIRGLRVVRCKFKMGWHYLVLKDGKAAKQQFEDGYRYLREVAPLWPGTEFRICGTVFLFHILQCAAAETGGRLSDEKYIRFCEDHTLWTGQPISSISSECKLLSRFLSLLLVGECLVWMTGKAPSKSIIKTNVFFSSAIGAFEEAMSIYSSSSSSTALSSSSLDSEGSLSSPLFIGTETVLMSYSWLSSLKACREAVTWYLTSIFSSLDLLTCNSSLLLFSAACGSNCLRQGDQTALLLTKLCNVDAVRTYPVIEAVCKLLLDAKKHLKTLENSALCDTEIIFSLVSLCFGPCDTKSCRKYDELLVEFLRKTKCPDDSLFYPRKGHYSPFTVLCGFSSYYHDCFKPVDINLEIFTASPESFTVDSLSVTIVRLDHDGKETCSEHHVTNTITMLSVKTPQHVCVSITLDNPGFYECKNVTGRVVSDEISFFATFELGDSFGRKYLQKEPEIIGYRPGVVHSHRSWFFAVKPVCVVDLEVPSSITAIEGEEVVVDIVIKTQHNSVENGTLVLPYILDLYDYILEDIWLSSSKRGAEYQKGYRTVLIDNLPSISDENPLQISVKLRCLRAGEYIVPILFSFRSLKYSDGEILERIQVNVNCPFSPLHSIMQALSLTTASLADCSLQGTSEVNLMVPEMSRAVFQREVCTLLGPRESVQHDVMTLPTNDVFLYETFAKNEGLDHIFGRGDEIFLITTLKCTSVGGLTLLTTDVVCTDAVSLLSISLGDHPCDMEYMENMTLAIKLSSRRTGKIPLGFIRLEFSPLGDIQRIVSEIPLPTIVVEDTPLSLIVKCPSTVILGSQFLLSLDVVNKTNTFQSCELIAEDDDENFCMGGRTQWSFSLSPAGVKTTEFFLQPLRVGTLRLPRISVKHSPGAATMTSLCISSSQKAMQSGGCSMPLESQDELIEKAISMAPRCDEGTLNQLRYLPLLRLTEKMSVYLMSEEHVEFALYVLSHSTIKRSNICDEELEVLLRFFCGKLSIQTAEAAIEALAVVIDDLSLQRTCSKLLFMTLSNEFLGNVRFQALPVILRRRGFIILEFMISKETTPFFTPRFLRLFLDAVDSESEPDLVLRVFELHDSIITQVDKTNMGSLSEDFFDSLSSYFPVVFSKPPGCDVTREDLKKALTRCMTRRLYLENCIPFLLSRLSSPSSVVKQDSIAVLLELFAPDSEYTEGDLGSHCAAVVSHLRNEILKTVSYGDAQDNSYLQNCLDLLRFVGRKTHNILPSSAMLWLEPISSGFLASLNSDRSVCAAYATMMYHLASSEICCGVTLVRYLLPTVLLNVRVDEVEHGNKILVLSALLSGLSDLRTSVNRVPGDETVQNSLKEALEESASALFDLVEKLDFEEGKLPSINLQFEFLSSFITLAAWLKPWMPDEKFTLALRKFIVFCLTVKDDHDKKIEKFSSKLGGVNAHMLDLILNDVIENESVLCPPVNVLPMFEGLMASSPSNALLSMSILLNPSRFSFLGEIPEKDVFLLCCKGLSLHGSFSEDAILHLVELLSSRKTYFVFEFLCELLIRLPPSRIREVTDVGDDICHKEVRILDVALLSCFPNLIMSAINVPGPYASLLLKTLTDKPGLCRLSIQGISALCKSSPGVYEIFLDEVKEANTENGLAVMAAVVRGLLVSGAPNQDAVRHITDKILHAVCLGVNATNALSVNFFLPGSRPSVGLLSCFLNSAQEIMPPVPLNVLSALTLLLKTESPRTDYDWSILLNFTQKITYENPSADIVFSTVELLECISSYMGLNKGLIIKVLLSNRILFGIVLSGAKNFSLHVRYASLSLLAEVALMARQWFSSEDDQESSCKSNAMMLRNEVLLVTQEALSDQKRVVRRAAAKCRHFWYKLF